MPVPFYSNELQLICYVFLAWYYEFKKGMHSMTIKPLKSVKLFFRKTVSKQWKEPFVQLWVKGTKKILQTIHSYWLAWMNFWRERFFYFWTHKANQSFWWLHLAFYSYFILTYDRASFVMRMIFSLLRHIFWYCSFYWHYCARFFQVSRNLMMILFFWLFFTDWHFFPLLHNRGGNQGSLVQSNFVCWQKA